MKREAILDYYVVNGTLYDTKNGEAFDQIQSKTVYEVIRIIDKVPLYLEEHLIRMRKSAEILGYEIQKSDQEIIGEMRQLIETNKSFNLNVKLLCTDFEKEEQTFLQYFIDSHYPKEEVYQQGIHTILFHSERENPNAKVINAGLRERVYEEMKKTGAFEAILVNQHEYMTEGSRSNIFFVKGNTAYTAPPGEVLLGVTRTRIMEVCKALNIPVVEREIHVNELKEMEGAFMTGTSVNVLPITTIDDYRYNSVQHPTIQKIATGYQEDMANYIASSGIGV